MSSDVPDLGIEELVYFVIGEAWQPTASSRIAIAGQGIVEGPPGTLTGPRIETVEIRSTAAQRAARADVAAAARWAEQACGMPTCVVISRNDEDWAWLMQSDPGRSSARLDITQSELVQETTSSTVAGDQRNLPIRRLLIVVGERLVKKARPQVPVPGKGSRAGAEPSQVQTAIMPVFITCTPKQAAIGADVEAATEWANEAMKAKARSVIKPEDPDWEKLLVIYRSTDYVEVNISKRRDKDTIEGDECSVLLSSNLRVVFESYERNTEGTEYVRFLDGRGKEVLYYASSEWEEDPVGVMGAIMSVIQNGVAGARSQAKRTMQ